MVELTQTELQSGKDALDMIIADTKVLVDKAERACVLACRAGEYDMRENLLHTAAQGHAALSALYNMRAFGGRIEGGNITRAGGT
jgi:hypothetical protein